MRDATVSDFFTKNPNLKRSKSFFFLFFLMLGGGGGEGGLRWWVRGAIVREFL